LVRTVVDARTHYYSEPIIIEGCWLINWSGSELGRFHDIPAALMHLMPKVEQASISVCDSLFIMDFDQWKHESKDITAKDSPGDYLPPFTESRERLYHLSECFTHYSLEKSAFQCFMAVEAPGGNRPTS
jgi:hypothetical protein